MIGSTRVALVIAGLVVGGIVSQAAAADRLFPDSQKIVYGNKKQELGSSWYLRGDMSWSRDQTPWLFATGLTAATNRTDNTWSASIGFGYKINSWFRADATLGYREERSINTTTAGTFNCPLEVRGLNRVNPDLSTTPIGIYAFQNQCRDRQEAKMQRGVLLFNGYVDLGTWSGVTPFVGAGVGAAYGRIRATANWIDTANNTPYQATLTAPGGFPIIWLDEFGNPAPAYQFGVQNRLRILNKKQLNLAWAIMGGIAIDVSPNAKLELSYRYLNLGKWGQSTKDNVAQDYRLGFRYMID